jgi:hypothetical protein
LEFFASKKILFFLNMPSTKYALHFMLKNSKFYCKNKCVGALESDFTEQ